MASLLYEHTTIIPLAYKSEKERRAINAVLYKKRIQTILRKKDTGTKCQLISNILEILRLVRRNQKFPELQNVRIVDGRSEIYDGKWVEIKMADLINDTFIMLQSQCSRARLPIEDLIIMSGDDITSLLQRSDPLYLSKHLDSFVNDDYGYNWEGEHLLDRDELVPHIIQCLTFEHRSPQVDSDKNFDHERDAKKCDAEKCETGECK